MNCFKITGLYYGKYIKEDKLNDYRDNFKE